ncbi:hypothetical protein [Teredinibacter purpureus]|uniref:hypothetical protein n=1 Tax=Teredinibacter purpureus TaxID=2731756 RepID=UPI0005F886E4|nr:hypothetical protein [Teredinibacter purpureus]
MRSLAGAFCLVFTSHMAVAHTPQIQHFDSTQSYRITGVATEVASGKPLYTEEHIVYEDGWHSVVYRDGDGDSFSVKELDYSITPIAPDVYQKNDRIAETFSIRKLRVNTRDSDSEGVSEAVDSQVIVAYQKGHDTEERKVPLLFSDSTVIDAGFDYYIKQHWQSLIDNKTKIFHYVVPTRQATVALSVYTVPCENLTHTCFRLRLKNRFLALLLKPIDVAYETNTQRLMRFKGVSNIALASGHYPYVIIDYQY